MYKFKVSKYKNVVANVNKKNEGWITTDINATNSGIHSNLIKSSASLIAYICEGGNIGFANINDFQQKPSILRAHGSEVSDLDFSPYDDGILASSSSTGQIKVWQLTQLSPKIVTPNKAIHSFDCSEPVESIQFHKTVETLLSFATRTQLKVYDLTKGQNIFESNDCSQIQSIDCKYDGKLYALSDCGNGIKIWDPRIDGSQAFALQFSGHDNDRDSRVIWLGDKPNIVSTGFNRRKAREAFLWDIRTNQKPITSLNEFEMSSGVWIPLFDFDTQMLFIAGRNDSAVNHWEANDLINGTAQFDNNGVNKKSIDLQIKGATLASKRALNIMETEVNRVIAMGTDSIAPVSYKVPRKSYREFHSDLFPETKSPDSNTSLNDWLELNDNNISTISLNPSFNKREKLIRFGKILGSDVKVETSDQEVDQFLNICEKDGIDVDASLKDLIENPKSNETEYISDRRPTESPKVEPIITAPKPRNPRPQRRGFTIRTTKFRHLKGTILGRETHITNFNGLSKTIPGECDAFKVNSKFGAVPIGPTCNQLAVLKLNKGMRLSGGVIPHLVCGHSIADFAFDPFDEHKIAIGCDTGVVQFWTVPEEGLTENTDEWDNELIAHNDRLTIIAFHPNASDVLVTFAMDLELIIWNTKSMEKKIVINSHSEPLFGISWSPDGALLATLCKDQKLRLFDPRNGDNVIREGFATQGSRGGRVCWAQKGDLIIVTGFSRVSERQFLVFDKNDLSKPIASEGLDVSPAILIPFYDDDSSTLFLTGKGDSTVFTFEISSPTDSAPYVHHLSHYNTPTPHQAIAYLYKCFCDVRNVEFARGYRLTPSAIEPISFTVPRLRVEYFQDDLFPTTKVLWRPALTSDDWFSGQNGEPEYISLKPEDMGLLSEAQPPAPPKKVENNNPNSLPIQFEGDIPLQSSLAFLNGGRQKQEMIVQQMSEKVQFKDEELPQELYEGVDPNEWDEN